MTEGLLSSKDGSTHWEGCYKVHHACAITRLEVLAVDFSRLTRELAESREESDSNRKDAAACLEVLRQRTERCEALAAELADARRALGRFGRHENSCRFSTSNSPSGLRIVVGCTCGLHAALKEPT